MPGQHINIPTNLRLLEYSGTVHCTLKNYDRIKHIHMLREEDLPTVYQNENHNSRYISLFSTKLTFGDFDFDHF